MRLVFSKCCGTCSCAPRHRPPRLTVVYPVRTYNRPSGHVCVEVKDTGAGIEPTVIERIFNAFEQGGADITRHFGGLGLGLAISKAIADLHDGRLTAFSAGEGTGATFTLELEAAGSLSLPVGDGKCACADLVRTQFPMSSASKALESCW